MRITIQLPDELFEKAKKKASEEARTITSLVMEGLTLVLTSQKGNKSKKIQLPVSKASGGVLSGMDINQTGSLLEFIDEP